MRVSDAANQTSLENGQAGGVQWQIGPDERFITLAEPRHSYLRSTASGKLRALLGGGSPPPASPGRSASGATGCVNWRGNCVTGGKTASELRKCFCAADCLETLGVRSRA